MAHSRMGELCLQPERGDEAEHWLEETAPPRADEPVGTLTYGLGVRAEILLTRGEVEAGLRQVDAVQHHRVAERLA